MSDLTAEAMEWLATHHNVIVTPMLRACGVSRTTCDRLVRADVLRNPLKGVFALASAPLTLEHRCAVLCAGHPSGFITGPPRERWRACAGCPDRQRFITPSVMAPTCSTNQASTFVRRRNCSRPTIGGAPTASSLRPPVDWLSTSVLICRR